MRRRLIRTPAFVRAAKRLLKRNPTAFEDLRTTLTLLSQDAFHPFLRTHKLKGELDGLWACSAGYDLRIVFAIDDHEEATIVLRALGTHDEVN